MKWTENYKTIANDADQNGVVSVSSVMRYMQDCANCCMEGDKPSYNDLFNAGYAFILSRFAIRLYAPIYQHQIIMAETWASSVQGLGSERYYRILRGDELIAEAASLWAIVGTHDKKLHRYSELDLHYRTDEPLDIASCMRFRMPQTDFEERGTKTVAYEDIDQNGHMNNAHYPDMLCGFIGGMTGMRVTDFSINYRTEAPLGEKLTVTCANADGAHYLRTFRSDGTVNVDAKIVTEKLN